MNLITKVYKDVRKKIEQNKFNELNDELRKIDVQTADVNIVFAMLTATAPIKSKLSQYKPLSRRFKFELKKRGLFEKGVLDGLQ